jgi:hypothetical protein
LLRVVVVVVLPDLLVVVVVAVAEFSQERMRLFLEQSIVLLLVLEDQILQVVGMVETAAIQLRSASPQSVVAVVRREIKIQVIQAVLEAAQRIGTTLVQRLAVLEQLDKDMQVVQSQLRVEIVLELVAEVQVQQELHILRDLLHLYLEVLVSHLLSLVRLYTMVAEEVEIVTQQSHTTVQEVLVEVELEVLVLTEQLL